MVFFVLTFLILNLLVLRGSDLALDLLICLSGALVGMGIARLAARLFGSVFGGSPVRRALGVFVGLASLFGIVFAGTALAGIPPFPTAEGGNVGNLIYGFAFGFGLSATRSLGGADAMPEPRGSGRTELKAVVVVLGTVAALFALLFVLYLLLEYLLVPLIRAFAG